ncbi:MAG: hypothetical protein E5W38_15430 [Mesorhizobium sp.]|uniref:hypothetical protein n=1 Tax=unclassified Mesorhizobium TaxID=325217 RepID=UPI000F762A57|nr:MULTISPECIES: hypothetical protein [unclassified Mesorhizobium]RWD79854.1 MAG: hypothetical protein EOS38_31065 [Mesorhizobium sp.]AZO24416.1 hypothetical protein EJ070_29495 [Mesorhizobium sp. M1E.F.Ca.ET.045.02.1.1]RUW22380.1 hypothetical protein EOA38_31090 [Mesorhizobium sp. M1E.F.Ca.ET.041.01.1.1]RUW71772.1 hypothetical protein EOA29_34205 [Mesorhizobium sp. M1E.F.Ca.ET.063.01.1.1]TIU31597.1 MAG: hypothetical protein E5W38_15430 [Mesorhizobium sp.]
MFRTILAASALTIGLATAAMAQSAGHMGSGNANDTTGIGSGQTVIPNPDNNIDTGTTGSIYGGPAYDDGMNSNADRNCAPGPQGAQPDASNLSSGTTAPTVNDNHCGK